MSSESSTHSTTSNSSYPYSNHTNESRRNRGFNTIAKNILGDQMRIPDVERKDNGYTSTIQKPNYHKPVHDYKPSDVMYKPPSTSSQMNTQASSDYGKYSHDKNEYSRKEYNRDDDILSRYAPKRYQKPEEVKQKDWSQNKAREEKFRFGDTPMNDTFTSQKAKRNVSDYQNSTVSRPVYSRERESAKEDTSTSPDFSIIGLENVGNT